jgi:hypothetical protein
MDGFGIIIIDDSSTEKGIYGDETPTCFNGASKLRSFLIVLSGSIAVAFSLY